MNALSHMSAAVDLLLQPKSSRCEKCGTNVNHCACDSVQCPYGDEVCESKTFDADMCQQCAEDCGYVNQMEIEL